jgi:hypothetical protein
MSRRLSVWATLWVAILGSNAWAQKPGFNEREVAPQITSNDREDVWTLHFRFQDPRIIVEHVPGRGTKIVWYMVYSVYNLDPKSTPRTFVPDIELVTLDRHTRHADEILPTVIDTIRKREDPTGRLGIKNSVTISEAEIPVSSKDGFPRAVTGVALWTDVDPGPASKDKGARTNKFSIFVAGLSNGYTEERPIDQPGVRIIKRKTLQLDFERAGDGEATEPSGIRWTGNATWIYRASTDPIKDKGGAPAVPVEKVEGKDIKNLGKPAVQLEPIPARLEPIPALPVKREK